MIGLGYRGKGKQAARSTVGKDSVTWGGGPAPLFVKAGELFKDGEVDVITVDAGESCVHSGDRPSFLTFTSSDNEIHIDAVPLSDPSAPQMSPIDVLGQQAEVDQTSNGEVAVSLGAETVAEMTKAPTPDVAPDVPHRPSSGQAASEDDVPPFYVDTDPSPVIQTPAHYDSVPSAPLGTSEDLPSEEEEIVFVPRTYRHPEPISVPVAVEPRSPPATASLPVVPVYMDPRTRTRADKKTAKKDKRGRKGRKSRRRETIIEGSDIEWGSDGPPGDILSVQGVDIDDADDPTNDVEVLRDYLEGTLLNAKAEKEEADLDGDRKEEDGTTQSKISTVAKPKRDDWTKPTPDEAVDEAEDEGDWESASGSGSSSNLGDLRAALAESVSEDESEETDAEEDMFSGKDAWDETDWFIRNMEVSHSLPPLSVGRR